MGVGQQQRVEGRRWDRGFGQVLRLPPTLRRAEFAGGLDLCVDRGAAVGEVGQRLHRLGDRGHASGMHVDVRGRQFRGGGGLRQRLPHRPAEIAVGQQRGELRLALPLRRRHQAPHLLAGGNPQGPDPGLGLGRVIGEGQNRDPGGAGDRRDRGGLG